MIRAAIRTALCLPMVMGAALDAHQLARHLSSATALANVSRANNSARLSPSAAGYQSAVQIYPWSEGAIFRLFTTPGQISDIALEPGENLTAVAAGDTVRWIVGDTSSGTGATKRTHILVKPTEARLTTNLVITTDRRSYHLDLESTPATGMAAVSWTYPADALISLKAVGAASVPSAPSAGVELDKLRFGYAISGPTPPWRPLRAFDDGRQTFIEFPATIATSDAPPLFIIDAHGAATLVNYRMQGRFYVVDRLFDVAQLRLGTKPQQIVTIRRVNSDIAHGRRA